MSSKWRHNADGLEDEKQREAHCRTFLVFWPLFWHVPSTASGPFPLTYKFITHILGNDSQMGLRVGVLEVAVACGSPRYWRAHLTADDTRRLMELLRTRSGCTWEALAKKLGYGESSGSDLMHLASGAKYLGAGRGISVPTTAARLGWLTAEEADSFTGAIACARDQIEAATSEATFQKKVVGTLASAATRELGLSCEQSEQLAHRLARQLLLDAKIVMSDDLLQIDHHAYCDLDEQAVAESLPSLSRSCFPCQ
jgi:hypothetical protein